MIVFYALALLTVLCLCGHLVERMGSEWQETRYRQLRRELRTR